MSALPDLLAGVRVLDFSQVLAGPYTARILAEMGADVIKVEAPAGDLTRVIAPKHDRGQSGLYTWANLGKRCVCIDLQQEAGRALAIELVRRSDVVLENFRPGVADRLGIGWEAVHTANPRAVMVSVNGYGGDSSWAGKGAFAPSMHAVTGLIEYQARKTEAASGVRPPMVNLPDARADLTTALHACVGLLAALRRAERTGQGQRIEIAMYDAVLGTYPETPFELLDRPEIREEPPPYDAGPNGFVAIAGPPQFVWAALVAAFGIADPAPPGADVPTKARLRHAAIESWMAQQPSREALVASLEGARIACAPVVTLREALCGDFARERELLVETDDRRGGTRSVTRLPYRYSSSSVRATRPAPLRGEHNAEVLGELLGLTRDRIAELTAAGVLLAEVDIRGQTPS